MSNGNHAIPNINFRNLTDIEVGAVKQIFAAIFASLLLLSTHFASAESTHEKKVVLGRTYVCHFGKYGVVAIDTRDPGTSITIGGIRYPASDGSYFYQTDDGKIAIAFNPKMTAWTYLSDENPDGITDSHCKVRANKK
ncbi:hypothetical protein [Burkholderia ubonensis]|uniref:hypothetical protein n=1 Tax=Burkholderia ubonensis TaxID=101571 RepID=UPI000B029D23|nr:hypothetical protein [Burkholderia ubonensis]